MRAVITFHSIDDGSGPLSYAPQDFVMLLETLAARQIPVVDFDRLLASTTANGVALAFDDGMRSVYTAALPVLRDHRAPAHLFLSTGMLEGATPPPRRYEMMSWDMVAGLSAAGIAIEGHTHRHPDLRRLADDRIDAECAAADDRIEQHVGRRPRYFAYPFGWHDDRVAGRIGARYAAAFTTRLGFLSGRDVRTRLPRLDAHYLRGSLARWPLAAPSTRAYLVVRKLLRQVRGCE